jgi:ABC-type dipeptide/oligopeptide/nickel transport system permease component
MITTIIKRLLQGLVVVFAILVITFILLRLIPGDPSRTMAPVATEAQITQLKEQMGIGDSIPVQFVKYIKNLFNGYLGYSYFQKADVITVIQNALPKTGILLLFTILLELVFGFIFGMLAAVKANTWVDKIISGFAVIFQSLPNYWVALILISLITVKLRLLPSIGYKGPIYALLPAIVLSLQPMAVLIRNIRASMIGSLSQGFVKAAKARGVPWQIYIFKYAFRNSLIPTLTLFGAQLSYIVGGIVVVEFVFGYPGIGLQTLNAIERRDYFLVQGLVVLISGFFVVVNTAIDIGYIYLDPRIRKVLGGL